MDEETEAELAALARAKAEREERRQRFVNSCGILNRKHKKSEEKLEWARKNCNCGAVNGHTLMRGNGLHAETCPVVQAARARRAD
jgi:IS5 family transposase